MGSSQTCCGSRSSQGEREQALKSACAITVETEFGDEPLATPPPGRVSSPLRPAQSRFWMAPPPRPNPAPGCATRVRGRSRGATATFRIHAVTEGEGRSERVWLHTHGLRRLGLPELEIVDVPQSAAGTLGEVINAMANAFLCFGMPPAGEPFGPGGGKSGGLLWLPLEQALPHLPRGMWIDDRDEDTQRPLCFSAPACSPSAIGTPRPW